MRIGTALAFGGATAILIALDRKIEALLPKHGEEIRISKLASQVGTLYALLPAVATLNFAGNPRLRNTGRAGARAPGD